MNAERGRLGRIPAGRTIRAIWQWAHCQLSIHGNVTVGRSLRLGSGSVVRSAHGLVIGDHVAIGRNCTIEIDGAIGFKSVIAANVGLVGRNDHDIRAVGIPIVDSTWIGDRRRQPGDLLMVGRDVWIGYGAIILSGCVVGDGAVIAAGSVVTRDVPAFAVVAGNPARHIRDRFPADDARRHLSLLDAQQDSLESLGRRHSRWRLDKFFQINSEKR